MELEEYRNLEEIQRMEIAFSLAAAVAIDRELVLPQLEHSEVINLEIIEKEKDVIRLVREYYEDIYRLHLFAQLHSYGVQLQFGSDFNKFLNIVERERPDQPIGEVFLKSRKTRNNFVWAVAWGPDNEIVATQASLMLQVDTNLGDFIKESFGLFTPPNLPVDLEKSRYRPGPGAKRMTGKICYTGEFWVERPRYRDFRGFEQLFSRLVLLEIKEQLRPDYIFGISSFFLKHFRHFGYFHAEPGAFRWKLLAHDKPLDAMMLYMSNEDIDFVEDVVKAELEKGSTVEQERYDWAPVGDAATAHRLIG